MAREGTRRLSAQVRRAYRDLAKGRERLSISPASEGARTTRPIFVFGLYRSGTTLVRYILDAHSNIACPPESDFLANLDSLSKDDRSHRGLNDLGFDDQHIVARMRAFADYFFANYAKARGKDRWADKTPRYVDHMEFIHSLFPDAQFVMVYRHPLDQIHSFTRGGTHVPWHLESMHEPGEDPRVSGARYWSEKTDRMVEFELKHASQCFRLRYEDLCVESETAARRLFVFLDEPWEAGVLRLSEHGHDLGMQDSKILYSSAITISSGGSEAWPVSVAERVVDLTLPGRRLLDYSAKPRLDGL